MASEQSLTELTQKVLTEYARRSAEAFGASEFTQIITQDIPSLIRDKLSLSEQYKVYGSYGNGRWVETPWIVIANKSITSSASRGYYVVILFDIHNSRMHLALGLGWTQFGEKYGNKLGYERVQIYRQYLYDQLPNNLDGFYPGDIDLGAVGDLSKGYEKSEIVTKSYDFNDLDEATLVHDLLVAMDAYHAVASIAGNDIENISINNAVSKTPINDLEKRINRATLSSDPVEILKNIEDIIETLPPRRKTVVLKKIVRNRVIAKYVKDRAQYICEVCGRKPFQQESGKYYAEADHIEALGKGGLDHPDNMRCLCAQCHAVITHGSENEISKLVQSRS